jgi:phosphatidylglycerol---prolipoprotein diacylglyceryl transferase
MSSFLIHAAFDVLAWLAAGMAALWITRSRRVAFPVPEPLRPSYLAALLIGAGLGAYALGSANLWLSGQPGLARSIEGAIVGAIVAIEIYKRRAGIAGRTGARFALPFAIGVAVGRIGCFLSGIDDFTHGTPTTLPWAHDFGDGIPRHPVQLYESAAMALFAALYVARVLRDDRYWIANGFYLAGGFYGAQRFVWEFLKPYGALVAPFTLFHLLSAALVCYAVVMIATAPSAWSGEACPRPDRARTRVRRKEHALSEPSDFVTGVEKRH